MEKVKECSKIKAYLSKTYKVVFHNDDKTTFEFVAFCLCSYFEKSMEDAIQLTYAVDKEGSCIAGSGYIRDVAETKKSQVMELAKENNFPFYVTVEED